MTTPPPRPGPPPEGLGRPPASDAPRWTIPMREAGRFVLTIEEMTDRSDAIVLGKWTWKVYDHGRKIPRSVDDGYARTQRHAYRKATRAIRRYLRRELPISVVTHIDTKDVW